MRKDNIPFKIGMQYENWEFNLDILPDRIKGLDSYLNILSIIVFNPLRAK